MKIHHFAFAAAVAAPGFALAQQAGTYTGTNNEGDQVQVVVAASGSGFEITGVSDGGTVYCTKAGTTYGYGVGFSGNLAAIKNHHAKYKAAFINVSIASSYTFSGSMVTGAMLFTVPILTGAKTAAACSTKPQTFSATLGADAAQKLPRGASAWPVTANK